MSSYQRLRNMPPSIVWSNDAVPIMLKALPLLLTKGAAVYEP
jgi:hypothetical protein